MATLVKRGKIWHVRFQHGGKDVCRSTKETKKTLSEEAAAKIVAKEKRSVSVGTLFDDVLMLFLSLLPDSSVSASRSSR